MRRKRRRTADTTVKATSHGEKQTIKHEKPMFFLPCSASIKPHSTTNDAYSSISVVSHPYSTTGVAPPSSSAYAASSSSRITAACASSSPTHCPSPAIFSSSSACPYSIRDSWLVGSQEGEGREEQKEEQSEEQGGKGDVGCGGDRIEERKKLKRLEIERSSDVNCTSLSQQFLDEAFLAVSPLSGFPSLVLPVSIHPTDGLPVALQLIAKPFEEEKLFKVAFHLEKHLHEVQEHLTRRRQNYLRQKSDPETLEKK
eukprot:GHVT01065455.1.p1 GENE.GHVT01065455.1~~GHVT01065455.1.p1  ORF type:complete len:256 (+),score=51.12 GHVT01065455.1:735-1502(+)